MKQAAKKKKLISIPKSVIDKYSERQVLAKMGKAEFEKAYTDATWRNLNNRLRALSK